MEYIIKYAYLSQLCLDIMYLTPTLKAVRNVEIWENPKETAHKSVRNGL